MILFIYFTRREIENDFSNSFLLFKHFKHMHLLEKKKKIKRYVLLKGDKINQK